MIKCVVCECASVLSYEVPGQRPPLTCPNCGRDTRRYVSMRQDDPRVQRMVENYRKRFVQNPPDAAGDPVQKQASIPVQEQAGEQPGIHDTVSSQAESKRTGYVLVSEDGSYRIRIPEQGGVIGRTGIGAHELAHNGRVSRQHLKVIPAKRAKGLLIEDISSNGTCLDGRRILAGQREFAVIGSEIRLSREVLILMEE